MERLKRIAAWLEREWWGLVVAYALLLVFSYLAIWGAIEPLDLPKVFVVPIPRWFYHLVATALIASHGLLVIELWRRRSRSPEARAGTAERNASKIEPGMAGDVARELERTKGELLNKDRHIKELQESLDVRKAMKYIAPFYWTEEAGKRDGPFCQQCYDSKRSVIRLQSHPEGWLWSCLTCRQSYNTAGGQPTVRVVTEFDPRSL